MFDRQEDLVPEMAGCRGIDRGFPVYHAFGQVWIMDLCLRGSLKQLKMIFEDGWPKSGKYSGIW